MAHAMKSLCSLADSSAGPVLEVQGEAPAAEGVEFGPGEAAMSVLGSSASGRLTPSTGRELPAMHAQAEQQSTSCCPCRDPSFALAELGHSLAAASASVAA